MAVRAIALAALGLWLAPVAGAENLTLSFAGTLQNVAYDNSTPPHSPFHGIALGTPASGTLTYDDSSCAAGCPGSGTNRTDHLFTSYSSSLQIGGVSLSHPTPQSNFRVAIINNGPVTSSFAAFFGALLGTPIATGTPFDSWVIGSQDVRSGTDAPSFGIGYVSFDTSLFSDTSYRRAPDPSEADLVYFFIADGAFLNLYFAGGRLAPDADSDAIPDATDNCPRAPNPDQANGDATPRGNACQCGDQNRDGRVNVTDIVAANLAIFTPALATPLCDTNRDGLCNVNDLVGINLEIFSPGETAVCALQPCPGLTLTCP